MKYLLPKARNTVTGQTVKTQDLTGLRYKLNQQPLAMLAAEKLAENMTTRTLDLWEGFVVEYIPSNRKD